MILTFILTNLIGDYKMNDFQEFQEQEYDDTSDWQQETSDMGSWYDSLN